MSRCRIVVHPPSIVAHIRHDQRFGVLPLPPEPHPIIRKRVVQPHLLAKCRLALHPAHSRHHFHRHGHVLCVFLRIRHPCRLQIIEVVHLQRVIVNRHRHAGAQTHRLHDLTPRHPVLVRIVERPIVWQEGIFADVYVRPFRWHVSSQSHKCRSPAHHSRIRHHLSAVGRAHHRVLHMAKFTNRILCLYRVLVHAKTHVLRPLCGHHPAIKHHHRVPCPCHRHLSVPQLRIDGAHVLRVSHVNRRASRLQGRILVLPSLYLYLHSLCTKGKRLVSFECRVLDAHQVRLPVQAFEL